MEKKLKVADKVEVVKALRTFSAFLEIAALNPGRAGYFFYYFDEARIDTRLDKALGEELDFSIEHLFSIVEYYGDLEELSKGDCPRFLERERKGYDRFIDICTRVTVGEDALSALQEIRKQLRDNAIFKNESVEKRREVLFLHISPLVKKAVSIASKF